MKLTSITMLIPWKFIKDMYIHSLTTTLNMASISYVNLHVTRDSISLVLVKIVVRTVETVRLIQTRKKNTYLRTYRFEKVENDPRPQQYQNTKPALCNPILGRNDFEVETSLIWQLFTRFCPLQYLENVTVVLTNQNAQQADDKWSDLDLGDLLVFLGLVCYMLVFYTHQWACVAIIGVLARTPCMEIYSPMPTLVDLCRERDLKRF